jgi:mRNA-degrading endonuclease RelE of RelBE toxin-antitoxin system
MRFKTTTIFDKRIGKLLNDEEYFQLRQVLAVNPRVGVVLKGTGSLRKMRWAVGHKGKSGGARIIYYWPEEKESPCG